MPQAQGFEQPFRITIETGRPKGTFNVSNVHCFDLALKVPPELRTVVSDQEAGNAEPFNRAPNQGDHVLRVGLTRVHFQLQQLSCAAIKQGCQSKVEPEYAKLHQVKLPHTIRLLWCEQMVRLDTRSSIHGRSWLPWTIGLVLPKDTLHRGSTDLDPGTDQMPGYRASTELGLRELSAKLVNKPTHGVVDLVPRRPAE